MTLLYPGDRFPTLAVALPGKDTLLLPDALAGGFGVVLFYRGVVDREGHHLGAHLSQAVGGSLKSQQLRVAVGAP